ncbi:MAG: YicC/YloC family endoribonuclease, partial [Granulosicoccus sp.]
MKTNAYELVCELRAVNHRYLDISIRLPEPVRVMEPSIRERLAGVVYRGKIDVSIKHTQTSSEQQSFVINEALLEKLTTAAAKVSALSGSSGKVDPLRMLQWPGVMDVLDDSEQTMANDSMDCFEQALQDFLCTREREGEQISQLLSSKTEQVRELVSEIRRLRPVVVERQTERWRAKFDQLSLGHDETRMEQELVYAAQRLDVDEELDRLDAHCNELHKTLKRHDPVGRRLDFLMQEFNREANTLSAKSADSDTTNFTV